jgi:hypothetical protein
MTGRSADDHAPAWTRRVFLKRAATAAAAVQAAGLTVTLGSASGEAAAGLVVEDRETLRALLEALAPDRKASALTTALEGFQQEYAGWSKDSQTAIQTWLQAADAIGGTRGLTAYSREQRRVLLGRALREAEGPSRDPGPIYTAAEEQGQAIHTARRYETPELMALADVLDQGRIELTRRQGPAPSIELTFAQQRDGALQSALVMARCLLEGPAAYANHPNSNPVGSEEFA